MIRVLGRLSLEVLEAILIVTLFVATFVLVACGDDIEKEGRACLVGRTCPDAAIDACVHLADAGSDCCSLLPNYAAASSCGAVGVPAGACGELACEQPDCSFVRVEFCGSGAP